MTTRLGTFLRHNWLGLVGILLGVVGLYGTYYFYHLSNEAREPVFVIDPDRTEIVSAQRIANAPIKVLRRNGTQITGDLYAVRFYFWNAGKRPIMGPEVLDTLQIVLQDPGVEILDYKVLKVSRPVARVHVVRSMSTGPLKTLTVTFSILEQNDGLSGQLIYEGGRTAPLVMAGTIEGVPRIETSTDISPLVVVWHALIVPSLGMAALILLLWGLPKVGHAIFPRLVGSPGTTRHKVMKVLGLTAAVTVLVLIVVGAVAAVLGSYSEQRAQMQAQAVNRVPLSLRP